MFFMGEAHFHIQNTFLPKIVIPVKQYVITLKLIYKVHEQRNKK